MTVHHRFRLVAVAAVLALSGSASAQNPPSVSHGDAAAVNGEAFYQRACAACHDGGDTRAPAITALRMMSPANVVGALETGLMKTQGSALSANEKRAVAEFVTGRSLDGDHDTTTAARCPNRAPFDLAGAAWNGWSPDAANTRFQPADNGGLTAADVPRLQLKWAFGFPNTFVANGQPTVVGGRVFVPSANRMIYSLDARSGCQYWAFESDASVRTAITVATLPGSGTHVAFFGDSQANVYGVDAGSGALVWKARADEHPRSKIIGAPVYSSGRLFVPVTAAEEGFAPNASYECCSSRGSLVAFDAATGRQIWKTFTIDQPAHVVGKNAAGTPVLGPSGASIWSTPTIDVDRHLIYVATGDNFTHPATAMSDAVVAFDMETGAIRWSKQLTPGDVWNNACISVSRANCPESPGPDADFASSPILARLSNGRRVLLLGQKSGVAYAVDPDREGELVWKQRVGTGGVVGGIQFGSAFDGRQMYVALSDMGFVSDRIPVGTRLVIDPKIGGGFYALDVETGRQIWGTKPPPCAADRPLCSPAQSAAVTAIPGAAFSGSVDGHLRAYAAADGRVIWDFDTARPFPTVNGVVANGGSINGPGPTVVNGMLYTVSGYGSGMTGNVLLAFAVEGR